MLVEGLVDVFQTVKNLRIQRPSMVQTLVSTDVISAESFSCCYFYFRSSTISAMMLLRLSSNLQNFSSPLLHSLRCHVSVVLLSEGLLNEGLLSEGLVMAHTPPPIVVGRGTLLPLALLPVAYLNHVALPCVLTP